MGDKNFSDFWWNFTVGDPCTQNFYKAEKFFFSNQPESNVSKRFLAQKDDSTRLQLRKLKRKANITWLMSKNRVFGWLWSNLAHSGFNFSPVARYYDNLLIKPVILVPNLIGLERKLYALKSCAYIIYYIELITHLSGE